MAGSRNYIKVLYDYEYTTDEGKAVQIKEGDECILLKKANSNWWHVIRKGDKKPIYVPAAYVMEIHKTVINLGSLEPDDLRDTDTSETSSPATPSPDEADAPSYPPKTIDNQNNGSSSSSSSSQHIPLSKSQDGTDDITLDASNHVPDGENSDEDGEEDYANFAVVNASREAYEKKLGNDEIENQPQYANLADIQAQIQTMPPVPEEGASPVKLLGDNWEAHVDKDSGRKYYFNKETRETSWKPPRISKGNNSGSDKEDTSSIDSDSRVFGRQYSMPAGWTEHKNEEGDLYFLNDITNEKWLTSEDDSGRIYFYREDGAESVWELPETPSPESSEEARFPIVAVHNDKPAADPPPPNSYEVSEKKGYLNKTKIMENGRKVNKKWNNTYIVLNGSNLVFYKDQKAAQVKPNSPIGKPDVVIDLKTAIVEWGSKDKSSRKNVIQVAQASGTQYLLQTDDPIKIHDWYITLSYTVNTLMEDDVFTEKRSTSPALPTVDENSDSPKETPSTPTHRGVTRKGSRWGSSSRASYIVNEPDLLSSKENRGKIRDRLIKLIMRRPSIEVLQEKGIIKDATFGSNLQSLCTRDKTPVPKFVSECIEGIESRGLTTDGIYRISGNLAQVQKLRFSVDQGDNYDLLTGEWDVHVLTGSLKLFFRELKEPLFPYLFFDKFLAAVNISDLFEKRKAFKSLIKVLPVPNKETIRLLFGHLLRVIEQCAENRMQIQNIAIVFGPTLLWPPNREAKETNMAVTMVYQNQIVEYILQEYHKLFS